jgi:hypothetical protein
LTKRAYWIYDLLSRSGNFPAKFDYIGGFAMSESTTKRRSTRRSAMTGALSAAEFRRAASQFPNMADTSLGIARAILVDGEQMASVVERTGVDRRNVHFWVKQIYDAVTPAGWVSEVVTLPRAKMDEVLELQAQERSKWNDTHAAQ